MSQRDFAIWASRFCYIGLEIWLSWASRVCYIGRRDFAILAGVILLYWPQDFVI